MCRLLAGALYTHTESDLHTSTWKSHPKQLQESPCPWRGSGPRQMALAKTSPIPAAEAAAGASPQHHQEGLPIPVFTVHSGGHKAFVPFKSDFKDAKRDVNKVITQGRQQPCCQCTPPQQTLGFTGVTITAHLILLMGMSPGTCPLQKIITQRRTLSQSLIFWSSREIKSADLGEHQHCGIKKS